MEHEDQILEAARGLRAPMATGLPIDVQNKIMLLAGAESAPTPARAKAQPPSPKPATPPAIPSTAQSPSRAPKMATGLPVDVQNKIMLLAGADSAPTPARAKAQPRPRNPRLHLRFHRLARPLLTPADRAGLLGGGPGFCVLRGFLARRTTRQRER